MPLLFRVFRVLSIPISLFCMVVDFSWLKLKLSNLPLANFTQEKENTSLYYVAILTITRKKTSPRSQDTLQPL